ncbi:MAG: hypothetical protein O3C27_15485 [Actinomycetota bacterium]|nr:hypothetical protein [Actinomycetota bacterium]
MQPLARLRPEHLRPSRSDIVQLAVRARALNRDTIRRRAERLRFRSKAEYIEFVIARAIERGRS